MHHPSSQNQPLSEESASLSRNRRGGFAVVIALSLMSFILLLLLSISAFVRVETQAASTATEQLKAQLNAKLGALIALGQLQKLTGPDQRATFPVSADSDIDQNEAENLARRTHNWVGVRDAALLNKSEDALNADRGNLLGWLVSGEVHSTPPASPTADPATGVDPETNVIWANTESETNDGYALLVGAGSTEPDLTTLSKQSDYVATPKVDIGESGAYAWWVGDNGTKAQLNLADPFLLDGDTDTDDLRHLTTQRAGVEAFFPSFDPSDSDQQSLLVGINTPAQFAVAGLAPTTELVKENFHNITTNSTGLATNVRYGGLKKDLTAVFQEAVDLNNGKPAKSDAAWTSLLAYQQRQMNRMENLPRKEGGIRANQNVNNFANRIFPPLTHASLGDEYGGPTWDQLVTWANTENINPNFEVQRGGIKSQGLWPVVAKIEFIKYITFDRLTSPTRIYYIIVPRVVLWNPHNKPLKIPSDMYMRWLDNPRYFPTATLDLVVNDGSSDYELDDLVFSLIGAHSEGSIQNENISKGSYLFDFRLESGVIPAGAAKIYSMTAHQNYLSGLAPVYGRNADGVKGQPKYDLFIDLLDRGGQSIPVLSSAASPTFHGIYIELDANAMFQKLASEKGPGWPDPSTNAMILASGLDGFTIGSLGPSVAEVRFEPNTLYVAPGNQKAPGSHRYNHGMLIQFDLDQGHLSVGKDYKYVDDKVNHTAFSLRNAYVDLPSSLPFTPSTYDPTSSLGEPPSSSVLYHYTMGLRLPDNFSLVGAPTGGSDYLSKYAPARLFANANPLASHVNNVRVDYYRAYKGVNTHADALTQMPQLPDFVSHAGESYAYIGYADNPAGISGSPQEPYPRFIASEIPSSVGPRPAYECFTSPASMQHANLRSYNSEIDGPGDYESRLLLKEHFHGGNVGPMNAIGNSLADTLIVSDTVHRWKMLQGYLEYEYPDDTPVEDTDENAASHYDYSYLLNQALWDDFILTGSANSRLRWHESDWNEDWSLIQRDFEQSAASLRIAGAFNVNSTSVNAWASLLSAFNGLGIDGQDVDNNSSPISRFNGRYGAPFDPQQTGGYSMENNFTGYRRLSADEIQSLAEKIVEQVRERGPFLSMGEFVNRSLLLANNDPKDHRLAGAIQSAINNSSINDAQSDNTGDPRSYLDAGDLGDNPAYDWPYYQPDHMEGSVTAGAPGYLTQADVLSRIGSILTTRSDTFTIRSYGEYSSGSSATKAWCEVVVQRQHDFLDGQEPDTTVSPADLSSEENRKFGRRYRIISVRWLDEADV